MPSPLIEIPSDDIFKNDKLGLEPAIASRSEAILRCSPQAIAINGHWGTGKTTFMSLWAAYLRHEGVKVVEFNAWKSLGADPFTTLTKEILRQVDIPTLQQESSHKRLLTFLARSAPLVAQGTKLASILQLDWEPVSQIVEMSLQSMGNFTQSEPNDEPYAKVDSPEAFTSLLSSAANSWSDRPVVVMIDELDRCSPEYSVEMLQLLEHVFYAQHIVFVVAVNLSELIHSVRAFYGQGFNAEGYLERFFDDIRPLPTSNRSQYIESSLDAIDSAVASNAMPFLEASGLSLREIDKSIQQLSLAIEIDPASAFTLVNLWIARTLAPVEYRQFVRGEISDKALAEAVFDNGTCGSLRTVRQGRSYCYAQEIEVNLIVSSLVLHGSAVSTFNEDRFRESELYLHHAKIVDDDRADGDMPVEYSSVIVSRAANISEALLFQGNVSGVQTAVRLLDGEPPTS